MHDTAMLAGSGFFKCYGPVLRILDIGAMDVNGTLRSVAPPNAEYIGVDLAAGPGVDLVITEGQTLPFPTSSFTHVVSSSCFEHDPMFWVTFLEMARVVRPGGYIYLSAPSNGPYHKHPIDCWRFYPDAGDALARWANRNSIGIDAVETFLLAPKTEVWVDCVMTFAKRPFQLPDTSLLDWVSMQ